MHDTDLLKTVAPAHLKVVGIMSRGDLHAAGPKLLVYIFIRHHRNLPAGKGQKKHITELYAIHPDATQERNIFRGDEFVMQTSAFPYDTDLFVKVCNILKIKCLTSSDFVATPIGKQDETADMVAIIRPRLLILSAIENPDRFQELYERYNTKLSQYHFVVRHYQVQLIALILYQGFHQQLQYFQDRYRLL